MYVYVYTYTCIYIHVPTILKKIAVKEFDGQNWELNLAASGISEMSKSS